MFEKESILRCKWLVVSFVVLSVFMFGNSLAVVNEAQCCIEIDLNAAQGNYVAGYVKVCNDATNLYVTLVTHGGWSLAESHLAIGTSLEEIPANKKGNPVPGRFPYFSSHEPPVLEYNYTIPLEENWHPGKLLYVAAHAVVRHLYDDSEETAWGGCKAFPNATKWSYYIPYKVEVCGGINADQ